MKSIFKNSWPAACCRLTARTAVSAYFSCYAEVKPFCASKTAVGHFNVAAGDLGNQMSPHVAHSYGPDASILLCNSQESGPEEHYTDWCRRVMSKQQLVNLIYDANQQRVIIGYSQQQFIEVFEAANCQVQPLSHLETTGKQLLLQLE
jgi:hypothetical protein